MLAQPTPIQFLRESTSRAYCLGRISDACLAGAVDEISRLDAARAAHAYRFRFVGREIGAIGVFYGIDRTIYAGDWRAAVRALYDVAEFAGRGQGELWEDGAPVIPVPDYSAAWDEEGKA
jgi:hypothetical protein